METSLNDAFGMLTQNALRVSSSSIRRGQDSVIAGAVLFDLNDTLIRTASIKPLRRAEKWHEAYLSLEHTSLPAGTSEFVAELKELTTVGVVTSSPRTYAETILAHHGLKLHVLVAGSEVKNPKPHPEGLLKAAAMLGVEASQCIYVCDHRYDVLAAIRAQITPVEVCWKLAEASSDRAYRSWSDVRSEIFRFNQKEYQAVGD